MKSQAEFASLPIALAATLLLSACGPGDAASGQTGEPAAAPVPSAAAPAGTPAAAPRAAVAPTWEEAANASYAGPMGEAFSLVDGTWEGAPYEEGGSSAPRAGLLRDFLLSGDLDGDGDEESVALLWTSGGGSGTFDYLVVLERGADGTVAEKASAALGDRVKVRSAAIGGGAVRVDTVQAGPGDAACCPGQKYRRTFVLEGDVLKESATEDQGRLSLADLAGEWRLQSLSGETDFPDGVGITLAFEGDRIAGRSGCNRYTGGVAAGETPGALSLAGPVAGTRMMCPEDQMQWEDRYLKALEGLRQFSFLGGRLVLSCVVGDAMETLVFERTPAAPGG